MAALNEAGLVVLLVLGREAVVSDRLSSGEYYRTWKALSDGSPAEASDISSAVFQLTNTNLAMDANRYLFGGIRTNSKNFMCKKGPIIKLLLNVFPKACKGPARLL